MRLRKFNENVDNKKEYDEIISQIRVLQKRKAELEKNMIESSSSFVDKFKIWYNSDEECHHEWMINSPILRALFDENIDEPRRAKTYELYDLLDNEDDFWEFMDGTMSKEETEAYLDKYKPAFEEAMTTRMKSFCADW